MTRGIGENPQQQPARACDSVWRDDAVLREAEKRLSYSVTAASTIRLSTILAPPEYASSIAL